MKRGDLVFSLYDEQRGIKCIGLVLESERKRVKVMWSSEHSPTGWWREDQLRLVSEGR